MGGVAANAERIVDGLHFGECPRWHDGRLWASDMWGRVIHRFAPDGSTEALLTLPDDDEPGGLGWLPDGRLLAVGMEGRRLHRFDADGIALHADLAGLTPWSCNDLVVTDGGTAFVSQVGFDLFARPDPLPTTALLRVAPDGTSSVAAEGLVVPNGMAVTGDGATLVVAETFAARLTRFALSRDGQLGERAVFADLVPAEGRRRSGPDGLCVDEAGAAWTADWIGSRVLRVEAGGRVTHDLRFDDHPVAVVLGGHDRRTLYVCLAPFMDRRRADGQPRAHIDAVAVDVPGAGIP